VWNGDRRFHARIYVAQAQLCAVQLCYSLRQAQAKTVSRSLAALLRTVKALDRVGKLGLSNARAVVRHGYGPAGLAIAQADLRSRASVRMGQRIFHEVREQLRQEFTVAMDPHRSAGGKRKRLALFLERCGEGLADVLRDESKVNLTKARLARALLNFCNSQKRAGDDKQIVRLADGFPNLRFAAPLLQKLELLPQPRQGRADVVRDVAGHPALRLEQAGVLVEHPVEGERKPVKLVRPIADRHAQSERARGNRISRLPQHIESFGKYLP
jgi:hypothetical protein